MIKTLIYLSLQTLRPHIIIASLCKKSTNCIKHFKVWTSQTERNQIQPEIPILEQLCWWESCLSKRPSWRGRQDTYWALKWARVDAASWHNCRGCVRSPRCLPVARPRPWPRRGRRTAALFVPWSCVEFAFDSRHRICPPCFRLWCDLVVSLWLWRHLQHKLKRSFNCYNLLG